MDKDNLKTENIKEISISKEMEMSFIDYAMSVIVSRAIPDAKDGLKPVHRRILYAMNGLEMTHNKAFKKSARAVGEVIAKYHPHGDSAVYDSLVRMAQSFSLRYPLVWGQGNFGSIDGDSAAAMRYTEAKLKKITSLMLEDIKKDTIDFQLNYDGSETEPKVLPGKIPNLLINGSTGIAVGMATSIPPHNLIEILNAAIDLFENDGENLFSIVKSPDFPTGGILVNKNEIIDAYKSGRGRAIVRSKTEIVFDEEKNRGIIYVTEIPYMVNKSNLILKIAELAKQKTIDSIADIKDESNRKGIRIVIKLKRGYIPEVELNKLFKLTPLQCNFTINMLALVNDRPKTLNLRDLISIYNDHQLDVLVRKTKFDLDKAENRKHILEGLSIALDEIDLVIKIIRASKDNQEAINKLIERFKLSDKQAKAILDMKLNRLTNLERNNLLDEINKLNEMIADYNLILGSKEEQKQRIIKMYNELIETYGDERRTHISDSLFSNIDDEDLIPKENVVITMSKKGYIKRLPIDEYRVQNRGGIGSRGASISNDDFINNIIVSNTHTDLLFFTSLGKVFKIRAHKIPELGKNAKGLPIINLIDVEKDEEVKALISVDDYNDKEFFFVTKNGIIKKTLALEFKRINRNGKKAIVLRDNDQLLGVTVINSNTNSEIILGNSNGKANRFSLDKIRSIGRNTSGMKGMDVDDGEVVDFAYSERGNLILSISEKGFGKLTEIDNYRITNRGGKGVRTIKTEKAGKLVGLTAVKGDEDLIIITDKGTLIRTELAQISIISRHTKGVSIVKLRPEEKIASTTIVRSEKEINEEIEKTKEIKLDLD